MSTNSIEALENTETSAPKTSKGKGKGKGRKSKGKKTSKAKETQEAPAPEAEVQPEEEGPQQFRLSVWQGTPKKAVIYGLPDSSVEEADRGYHVFTVQNKSKEDTFRYDSRKQTLIELPEMEAPIKVRLATALAERVDSDHTIREGAQFESRCGVFTLENSELKIPFAMPGEEVEATEQDEAQAEAASA